MTKLRARFAAGAAAVALAGGALFGTASPAAAAYDGHCGHTEFCLYYNTNWNGGLADFGGDISNYSGYAFWGTSYNLNDNSASAKNMSSYWDVHLHEAANYAGAKLEFNPNTSRSTLGALSNKGSSHRW
ncbi:peptidase inhibitor family I36 protein [Actinoplanes sp. NPDC051346]|uniref:peptidase inhibitor family I36 protein n=1 Tax=Actinoplanes sp. NPDC051346 TaxID=3155048 RepID=UPI0034401924